MEILNIEGKRKERFRIDRIGNQPNFCRPWRDLIGLLDMLPSHKWLGYFRLSLRDKEADAR
jgi:hypothetical protein